MSEKQKGFVFQVAKVSIGKRRLQGPHSKKEPLIFLCIDPFSSHVKLVIPSDNNVFKSIK